MSPKPAPRMTGRKIIINIVIFSEIAVDLFLDCASLTLYFIFSWLQGSYITNANRIFFQIPE